MKSFKTQANRSNQWRPPSLALSCTPCYPWHSILYRGLLLANVPKYAADSAQQEQLQPHWHMHPSHRLKSLLVELENQWIITWTTLPHPHRDFIVFQVLHNRHIHSSRKQQVVLQLVELQSMSIHRLAYLWPYISDIEWTFMLHEKNAMRIPHGNASGS